MEMDFSGGTGGAYVQRQFASKVNSDLRAVISVSRIRIDHPLTALSSFVYHFHLLNSRCYFNLTHHAFGSLELSVLNCR
jgi:hypothetical protein